MHDPKKPLNNAAETATDAARKTASSALDAAKDAAQSLGAEVQARAADTLSSVKESAAGRLEGARESLSDTGDRLAESLRRAAEKPEEGSIQQRVLTAVAGGVADAAGTLRNRSASEIAADLRGFARRNPGAFAAGAAVAGFALARFLRSSAKASEVRAEARPYDRPHAFHRGVMPSGDTGSRS